MLPGKSYKPEELLRILRKRMWIVLVPFAVISASTAVIARMLPDMYMSQALIKYVPPQVPESIMRPLSTASLTDRLRAIEAVILSRTRLEQIVRELDLYKDERNTRIMDDVITTMRRQIRTAPRRGDIFEVQFVGNNPQMVMKVTSKLASFFVEESLKDGQNRADRTALFVEGEVDDKKRELIDIETRIREYKTKFAGELPSQQGANLAAVNSLQNQLQQLGISLQSDKSRQLFLEQAVADLESQAEPGGTVTAAPTPVAADPNSIVGTAQQKLNQAKAGLEAEILKGHKPTHPDYQRWARLVKMFEKEVNDKSLQTPVSSATAGLSPAEQNRMKQLSGYRNELTQLKEQMVQKESQQKLLRQGISEYQAKADRAPYHEAQLTEIQRDYDMKNDAYQSYRQKSEQANLTVNLQRRQIGEQFVMLDEAPLPQAPYSPNRLLINILGLVLGLVFGLAIVALLEYRDTSFKTDNDLNRVLSLPVLAVVPLMQSDQERRRRFRRHLMMNFGFGSTVAICMAVVAYTFVTMR